MNLATSNYALVVKSNRWIGVKSFAVIEVYHDGLMPQIILSDGFWSVEEAKTAIRGIELNDLETIVDRHPKWQDDLAQIAKTSIWGLVLTGDPLPARELK